MCYNKNMNKKVMLITPLVFVGSCIAVSCTSAASETKTALVRVAATCTMDSSVTSAHTKNIPIGTYEEGIGNTLVSVACNDAGGFGVYAIGYTGDTDGNNKLVHGTNSSIQINTGTATSGENSQWAMKLTGVTTGISATIENGYNNYSVVPSSYVKVASYPSATTTSNTAKFNTLYAAYINSTQAAGTYTGKVKYVLVHPASETPQEPPDDDPGHDSPSYPKNTLYRAYEIAYNKANKPMYVKTNDLAPYPIGWKPMESGDTGEVRFAMQDIGMTFEHDGVTDNVCGWAQESRLDNSWLDEALVLDLRDGKSYWIAKLGDSKCWMTQNLDFNLTSGVALNSTTSDLKVINDQEGYYNAASGYSTSDGVIYWTPNRSTTNSLSNMLHSATAQASFDSGNWYWTDTWYDSSNASAEDFLDPNYSGTHFSTTPFQGNGLHGHVGNYYNYTAAVAMNSTSSEYYSDRMPNSICPAGWQLPNVHEEDWNLDDFTNLWNKYGISMGSISSDVALTAAPFYLVRGSDIYNKNLEEGGKTGYYFTNGPDSSLAGGIYFYTGWLSYGNDWYTKYEAASVRCISIHHAT